MVKLIYMELFAARTLYGVDEEDPEDDTVKPLSDQCADEVERVLEERAISVQLHPEIGKGNFYRGSFNNHVDKIRGGRGLTNVHDVHVDV